MIYTQNLHFVGADGQSILSDISVSFEHKTGLVGDNGAGKSTLVRLLIGLLQPTSGTILRKGTYGYLEQQYKPSVHSTIGTIFDVADQLAALIRIEKKNHSEEDLDLIEDWALIEKIYESLSQVGLNHISLEQPVHSLSGGELTKLGLAAALWKKPDFLILDEPTNHIDRTAREYIYSLIQTWNKGLLVVSHDRKLLSFVDQIAELRQGTLFFYGGNFAHYYEQKAQEKDAALRALVHAQKTMDVASKVAQLSSERQQRRQRAGLEKRAQGGQAKSLLDHAAQRAEKTNATLLKVHQRTKDTALHDLKRAQEAQELSKRMSINFSSASIPNGKIVLQIDALSFWFEDARPLFSNFSLSLVGPEKVALRGANGTGKSTLLKLICGMHKPTLGTIKMGVTGYAYLDQHLTKLDMTSTVLNNYLLYHENMSHTQARNELAQYLFEGNDVFKKVSYLSSGERLRLALACVFSRDNMPQLLLLDEPTNYLDFESMHVLEKTLTEYTGALLIASHDDLFIEKLAIDRTITLGDE